ncbi:MAG: hypothetical protein LBP62_06620 [Clostridiales bacterium]|nr:hypothetical protein [Clostridiales bacterium]
MKFKLSQNIEYNQAFFYEIKDGVYLNFLKFAFGNSDMISLCASRASLEKALRIAEKYGKPIINDIIDSEITDKTHCSIYRGGGIPVFYFRLSEAVKDFLNAKKSLFEYECNGSDWLDDLVFYEKGVCRLSTCTHEGFIGIDIEKLKAF